MESLLKDLYRKQSHQIDRTEFALDVLNSKLDRRLSHYNKWADDPNAKVIGPKGKKVRVRGSAQLQPVPGFAIQKESSIEEQIQDFGTKVAAVPGFEELEGKTNPCAIVFWSIVLFLLIALTGYSFVHLIMDYLDNPSVTNVHMQYSQHTSLPSATLCVPFHIDRIPFAGKSLSDSFYPWKETSELLKTLQGKEHDLSSLFSCLDSGEEEDVKKEKVKVQLINEKGKQNTAYGRVHVALYGVWGTVCGNQWDKKDAQVVCRMITGKYSDNATTLHPIQEGAVPNIVWMDNVNCTGAESNIGHCTHDGWGRSDCNNMEFAAVDCTGNANPDEWDPNTSTEQSGNAQTESKTKLKQSGNESSIGQCSYELTSEKQSHVAGVDCTGKAEERKRLTEIIRNFTVGRTAAALLARITAFETWTLVYGETPSSFKWSSSRAYPSGHLYKEKAINTLLVLMEKSGHGGDLSTLQKLFACGLCDSIQLGLYLQVDKYTQRKQKVFGCNEATISWVEDSVGSHRVCFKLPLDEKTENIQKGTFLLSLDLGKIYGSVDWSNVTVKELYADDFKLDLSGSVNAEKETVETVRLGAGEEQTITVDAAANYVSDKDCNQDFDNCELKCVAKEFHKACAHRCTPFTWESLLVLDKKRSHCLLEDYRQCYRHVDNVGAVSSKCLEQCDQPCEHMTYSVRTLFKKPLPNANSETKLFIKMDSEVYPEFTEESVMNWYQLMGDLGGVIGLWLGASFVGVLHFIEYIILDLIGARKLNKVLSQSQQS